MIRYLKFMNVAVLAMAATACGAAPVDRCLQAKDVLQCQQVVKAGGSADDYLLYGMAGYMLGTVVNGGQRQTVIMADPHYRGYRPPVASYQRPVVRKQVMTTTSSVRKGSVVTTTVKQTTWSGSRPSYRSTYGYGHAFSSRRPFRSGK